MSWNDYLSIVSSGLAANRPTSPDKPELPRYYLSSDTGAVDIWNPIAKVWSPVNGPAIPQSLNSAGATQGNATAITSRIAIVTTATASSKGVLLPVAATGLEVTVYNKGPTFGTKVYPNTHGIINAGSSNAADTTVLAKLKAITYLALDTVNWVAIRSA